MVEKTSVVEGEKSPEGKSFLSAKEISDAIKSLKKFTPNKVNGTDPIGRVVLPHPLSYRRRVCWVARGLDKNTSLKATLRSLLADIGIKGKMKVTPVEYLQTAIASEDIATLTKFAQDYDTHLADRKVLNKIAVFGLYSEMSSNGKHFNKVEVKQNNMEKILKEALSKSFILANASKDAYVWKVAHTGLTDAQIVENVAAALGQLSNWTSSFPKGVEHFKSIHLKLGDNEGVSIYTNKGVVEDEVEYHRHTFQKVNSDDVEQQKLFWLNRQQEKVKMPVSVPKPQANKSRKRKASQGRKMAPEKVMKLEEAKTASPGKKSPEKSATPNCAKRLSAGEPQTPGMAPNSAGTPNSSGKKKRNRKSKISPLKTPQSIQNDGTPGSGKKKTPKSAPKMRLRQRASVGFQKEKLDL